MNGEEFDHNKEEGVLITIGDKRMVDGFEDNVIGMKVGDKRDFDLTLKNSEDSLEGKVLHFEVLLLEALI